MREARGNGIASVYEYDVRGRVTKLSTERNGTLYVDKVYAYNVQNSIEEISTTTTAAAQSANFTAFNNHIEYNYDGLNRLVKARGIATRYANSTESKKFDLGYRYASNGNLTEKIVSDYDTQAASDHWTYTYNNHKVTAITTTAHGSSRFQMGYDAVGNTTSKADAVLNLTKLMTYDSQNRIQNVENSSTHEVMGEYRYDDQGFRVYKKHKQANAATTTTPASTTIYELETPNKYFAVERQKDLANNPVPNTEYAVNNVFLDGVRIAAVVPTGQARWFMTDQVDSVNVVTNDNGDAISAIDYLPYGETWYQEGDTGFSPKYNSQELDKESGLYFFNARHYDPEIARFETADSVVDGEFSVKGWNRYMYVGGNPIMYKDPTGHWSLGQKTLVQGIKNFFGSSKTAEKTPETPVKFEIESRIKLNIRGGTRGVNIFKITRPDGMVETHEFAVDWAARARDQFPSPPTIKGEELKLTPVAAGKSKWNYETLKVDEKYEKDLFIHCASQSHGCFLIPDKMSSAVGKSAEGRDFLADLISLQKKHGFGVSHKVIDERSPEDRASKPLPYEGSMTTEGYHEPKNIYSCNNDEPDKC